MENFYSRLTRFYHWFGKFYARRFTPLLEETGCSMREMDVLLFLANNAPLDTARDVTEYRRIAKSQVSEAVENLTERGLIHRMADTVDRRVIHLSITEEGWPVTRKAQKIQDACWQEIMQDLSSREREQLSRIMEKLFAGGERRTEGES